MVGASAPPGPQVQGPGCGFVLWWAIASALGGLLGLGLIAGATAALATTLLLPPVQQFVLAFLAGLALGTVQWLVLHDYLPTLGWWEWTLYTAVSSSLANLLFPAALVGLDLAGLTALPPGGDPAAPLLDPATLATALELLRRVALGLVIAGALTGVAQWIVLRQYVRGAFVWIPTYTLGNPLGLIVGALGAGGVGACAGFSLALLGRSDVLATPLGLLLVSLVGQAVVVGGVALVTAPVLIWLLRRAYPPT